MWLCVRVCVCVCTCVSDGGSEGDRERKSMNMRREASMRHKIIFPKEPDTMSRKYFLIWSQGVPNKKPTNTVIKTWDGNALPFCFLLPFIFQKFLSSKPFFPLSRKRTLTWQRKTFTRQFYYLLRNNKASFELQANVCLHVSCPSFSLQWKCPSCLALWILPPLNCSRTSHSYRVSLSLFTGYFPSTFKHADLFYVLRATERIPFLFRYYVLLSSPLQPLSSICFSIHLSVAFDPLTPPKLLSFMSSIMSISLK